MGALDVDKRWGRATARRLLGPTGNAQALAILGARETMLLADWLKAAA